MEQQTPNTVEVEQTYNTPIEKVWQAITDKDKLKKWFFDVPEFKPEVGFEFEFTGGPPGKTKLHKCAVTKVIPRQLIAYTWRFDGYPGDSVVTWELFAEGDKTRLKLIHTGIHSFYVHPEFAGASFAPGWIYLTGTILKEFVEKQ